MHRNGIWLWMICALGVAYGKECSLTKTNRDCTLTIDRLQPLVPPAIQMYPGARLQLRIRNPYPFERYFRDFQGGKVAPSPDVASTLVGSLLVPLQKGLGIVVRFAGTIQLFELFEPPPPEEPKKQVDDCSVENVRARFPGGAAGTQEDHDYLVTCFRDFATKAEGIYRQLEPAVAPDSRPHTGAAPSYQPDALAASIITIPVSIDALYDREGQLSSLVAGLAKADPTAPRIRGLAAIKDSADAVVKDLLGYSARIRDLESLALNQEECEANVSCVFLENIQIPKARRVTEEFTYNISALNLVQHSQVALPDPSKKKIIAAITVVFGDSRWEGSAGTMFSTLVNRSFGVTPVFGDKGEVTDKVIVETTQRPTVIPFAAANCRIVDLRWVRSRSALYWTTLLGVNPTTASADFGNGLSVSWRALLFSALWHVGHDTRLTQNLRPGQRLGAGFSTSVTSATYWKLDNFAFGVSIRIPALAGR